MRRALLVIAACLLAALGFDSHLSAADAAPAWAPAATATVHPGVMTDTQGAQCTANFIYSNGTDVYIGQAAHCAGTGGNTETNGCTAGTLPLGTAVGIDGASHPGTLVYSSWVEMQQNGETDAGACAYNDFALVKLHPDDTSKTNPSVPFFGGPTALDADGTTLGERVYSYGNSSLRGGIAQLSPKRGISLGTADGWSHSVYTMTPGIPGDSGSAFVDDNGWAIGVLSTLAIAPIPASNGVSDLASMLDYMHDNTNLDDVTLVPGTEAFDSGRLF